MGLAISRNRQKAFASWICRGVLHSASNNTGELTNTETHLARRRDVKAVEAVEEFHAAGCIRVA